MNIHTSSDVKKYIVNVFKRIDPDKAYQITIDDKYAVNFFDEAVNDVSSCDKGHNGRFALKLTFMTYLLRYINAIDDFEHKLLASITDGDVLEKIEPTLADRFIGHTFDMKMIGESIYSIALLLPDIVKAAETDDDKYAIVESELALCKKFIEDVKRPRA